MSGSLLSLCLLRNRFSSAPSLIKNPHGHGLGRGFESVCPIFSILSSTSGRLEQCRNMGGGPRTFPGGLSKWQWKRMHEKKARHKEKTLLQQDRQVYLARIRSQLRGKIVENDDDNTHNINVARQDASHSPMTPKDQVTALSDRFMKMGAEDLWNEDDGPLTCNPSQPPSSVHDSGAERTAEIHRWNKEKVSVKGTIKDSLRNNGSGSILFSRGFSARSGRSTGVDRGWRFSDKDSSGQRRSRGFERDQRFSGDNEEYGDKRSGGIDRDRKFSDVKEEYSERRSRGFDREGKIRDHQEQSSDRRRRGFDREGKVRDNQEQSSDRRRSRGLDKDREFSNANEDNGDQRKNRGFSRDVRFSDDIEEYIDQTRSRGFDRDGRLSDNNKEYSGQKGRGIDQDRRFTEEQEVNNKQQRGQINKNFDGSDGESGESDARSTVVPKSLIDDEMELDSIIDEEMTVGLKFQNELLNSKDFYESDKRDFRGPKPVRMGEFRSKRRTLVDSDEDDDVVGFRNPKAGRFGGTLSSFSGRMGESRSNRRSLVDSEVDDDKVGSRDSKAGRFGGPVSAFSGRMGESRSKRRSLVDSDEEAGFRNPKSDRFGGPVPAFSGSRIKRQSMRGLDKADEKEFGWAGPGRRGRSLSYYTGSKRQPLRDIDMDQKTEFRLKISRVEGSMPTCSSLRLKRESFTGSDEEEENNRFRQPGDEGGLLRFGSRSKRQDPRDMENVENEEENSDKELIPAEFCKKKQPMQEVFNMESHHPWKGEEQASYLSQSRFDQCNISLFSLQALLEAGYVQLTVVQEATLPVILEGKDVLAKGKTGTGKTLAFLLPAIEVVVKTPPLTQDQRRSPIIALVVCPTRELASQTAAETNTLLRYHSNIGVQVVIGGTRLHVERKRLETDPCQILVATPGRLLFHIENTPGFSNQLMRLKVLILDEADHLLDLGFRKDLEKIIDAIPRQRQSLLFSATIPQQVHQISQIALKRDHAFINTVGLGCLETHAKVLQKYLITSHENHFHILYGVLKEHISEESDYKVLVFCTTTAVTRVVYEMLLGLNMNVREIHSRKTQAYRTHTYDEFQYSKCLILVTSDVSARGVDYPDVTLVVQMGLPSDREQYIHRLGRTGRQGKEGHGLLLLAPWEEFFLAEVQDLPIKRASLPEMHSEIISRVQHAIANVDLSAREYAYHAWLGYYNSVKAIGRDKTRLVELANQFSRCIGLEQQPELLRKTALKMGLKGIPGLRIKKK